MPENQPNVTEQTTPSRFSKTFNISDQGLLVMDFLAENAPLSKQKIKDLMQKGGVWLKRGSKPAKRLRRVRTELQINDHLQVYYNPHILAEKPASPDLIANGKDYSVWYKPPGMLSQGTEWGDHCAILRIVEQMGIKQGQVYKSTFPVHRLDKEAAGIMIVAHSGKAAGKLSHLLQNREIQKFYRARVEGQIADVGEYTQPLDKKSAVTQYKPLFYDQQYDQTLVDINLITGRKHQIRRHFSMNGYPLVGDELYGSGADHTRLSSILNLLAYRLSFDCPFRRSNVVFELPDNSLPEWCKKGD